MGREVGSGGRVLQELECPKKSLRLSLPGSCKNLISIFKLNPADFGQSWATRWSFRAKSKNTSGQWVLEGVCQISNLKSKKLKKFELICKKLHTTYNYTGTYQNHSEPNTIVLAHKKLKNAKKLDQFTASKIKLFQNNGTSRTERKFLLEVKFPYSYLDFKRPPFLNR
jgi:hypothetical protein